MRKHPSPAGEKQALRGHARSRRIRGIRERCRGRDGNGNAQKILPIDAVYRAGKWQAVKAQELPAAVSRH